MSDENDPLVHIVGPGGDKWNVCLNRLGMSTAAGEELFQRIGTDGVLFDYWPGARQSVEALAA